MRITLILFGLLFVFACKNQKTPQISTDELLSDTCKYLKFVDNSFIRPVYRNYDTLPVESISISRKKVSASLKNNGFKGKFLFHDKYIYDLIVDTTITYSIYTKHIVNHTYPTACVIEQDGCEFPLTTSLSSKELRYFNNLDSVICDVYVFEIHTEKKNYYSLILYKIEKK